MKILPTGICGFVGASLARCWRETEAILDEIARHAASAPGWPDLSAP